MERWMKLYEAEKKAFLSHSSIWWCCWCSRVINLFDTSQYDFHHPNGRRTLTDLLTFIPIHKHCHIDLHNNPKRAKALGLLS